MSGADKGVTQEEVRDWFNGTYATAGLRYLRPLDAYPIFLQLLDARPGERLLDVACGPGQLLRTARLRGVEAAGVDISGEAIRMARERTLGAEVHEANAESLPFADDSFDCVTCIGSLERMLDLQRVLTEIQRVAKPDARFCFMVRNAATLSWRIWSQALGRRNVAGHQDARTLDDWVELFERSGFVVQEVHPDQWPRQRVAKVLRGWRDRDPVRPERIRGSTLPLAYANEFVFVLRRAVPGVVRKPELEQLYDALARFQWRRRGPFARAGSGLAIRKRLREPHADLDAWLADTAEISSGQSVLDVGCGFGATLLAWSRRGITGLGISPVAFQVHRARAQARRLGVDDAIRFAARFIGEELSPSFDVAVSIETLLHAADLDAAVAWIAGRLRDGGRLVLVEDMAAGPEVESDADAALLLDKWHGTRLPTVDAYRDALARAGLQLEHEVDLTPSVRSRSEAKLAASERRLARMRGWPLSPKSRRVVDAFLGGVALERLYARGHMRYVAMVARLGSAPR